MAKENGLFLKKRRSYHPVFWDDMTFLGGYLSLVLSYTHTGFYDINHIAAEFLAFTHRRCRSLPARGRLRQYIRVL